MTAGAVAVPTIIPLKVSSGPKHVIDSATRIELRSGENAACHHSNYNLFLCFHSNYTQISINLCPFSVSIATTDALIFYTLNGTRPDPYQRLGESHTHTYEASFTLHPGKVRNCM